MTSASAVSLKLEAGISSSPEWESAVIGRHNLLLEGPTHWTAAVLHHMAPLLRGPVIWTASPLTLPLHDCGLLVVLNVEGLDPTDQAHLFAWLDQGERQVIATTSGRLFPMVAAGHFDEPLYYRLNVIRMCARPRGATARAHLARSRRQ
jgi:hypothetical protein